MSEAFSAIVSDSKSNLSEAAAGGVGDLLQILQHSVDHLADAAKALHPDVAQIEAELKPIVADLVKYAFSLLPGSALLSFLAPRIEDFGNHLIDLGLKKLFPAAA